ncbi:TetR/AcrR family transcriptional regulator [Actinocorallia sp. B10E7]|uniref:TetR/AcrR family transcriptional regulator n=1 Tax=Actinocorallia sp. B10E7 TaxID=3153558 RepID=UPI00325E3639
MPPISRSRAVRERRDEVARRVLAAVHRLVADGTPYTELPVQRIAEAAGVARSTFYLHFPDKSRLLIALAEQGGQRMFDAAITWWRGDHSTGPDGVAEAIARMIAEYRANRWVLLAVSEVSAYDPDVTAYYQARLDRFTRLTRERLDEERLAGTVSPGLDSPTTAALLTWMVERTISMHCRDDDTAGDEQLARSLGRAIWLTVYGDPAPGR